LAYPAFSENHGGIDLRELERMGIQANQVIDFSVNSNPFGPAPCVVETVRSIDFSSYPDRESSRLRKRLAAFQRVEENTILVGNGTSELIWLIAQAFLNPGDTVIISGPTFGEYRRAAEAQRARVIEVRAQSPVFRTPIEEILIQVKAQSPRLVFLCNPNNPTGQFLPQTKVEEIIKTIPEHGLLVLDEAYQSFLSDIVPINVLNTKCIYLKSMTKDFALTGLRLGYALAEPVIISQLKKRQPAWSVNALAQAAGEAALTELDYYRDTLSRLKELKNDLFSNLALAGFSVVPSEVHFGLMMMNIPAREMRERLLGELILVRDCTSFGLSHAIRFSTRLPTDNLKLIQSIKKCVIDGYNR
jgi:histidinol-phosphate aminotransferase